MIQEIGSLLIIITEHHSLLGLCVMDSTCNVTNEFGSVVSPVITVYGKGFNVYSLTIFSLNS